MSSNLEGLNLSTPPTALRLFSDGVRNPEAEAIRLVQLASEYGAVPVVGRIPDVQRMSDIPQGVAMKRIPCDRSAIPGTGDLILMYTVTLAFREGPKFFGSFGLSVFEDRGEVARFGAVAETDEETVTLIYILSRLAPHAYASFRPDFGILDTRADLDIEDVVARRIPAIGWQTIFGPAYVERYGRDFLLAIPGYLAQLLPDGGVFHQLTPTYLVTDISAAAALREEVRSYFARVGLRVACYAPYVRRTMSLKTTTGKREDGGQTVPPGGSDRGAADGPGDAPGDFIQTLTELLRATFTLKDGTRAKVLYLSWNDLSPQQRAFALDYIVRAVETEAQKHPGTPIRWEFNEVPPDLAARLAQVARRYPRISYARVEMHPRL